MIVSEPYVLIFKNGITINGVTYPLAKDSIHKPLVHHFTVSKMDIYFRNNINILEIRYYGSDITTEETIKIPIPMGEEENAKKVLNYFGFSGTVQLWGQAYEMQLVCGWNRGDGSVEAKWNI